MSIRTTIHSLLIDSQTILLNRCKPHRSPFPSLSQDFSNQPHQMNNRPRNRQPRPPRGGRGGSNRSGPSNSPRPDYHPVPSIHQVIPGASVSIVLKQDQPTGREVQGKVQDLLTRGDHPRGIKVRLTDGRVGRVQRMVQGDGTLAPSGPPSSTVTPFASRADDFPTLPQDGPPPRTLADFIVTPGEESSSPQPDVPTFLSATAKCPICGIFEGDEIAVSRHVDSHLT